MIDNSALKSYCGEAFTLNFSLLIPFHNRKIILIVQPFLKHLINITQVNGCHGGRNKMAVNIHTITIFLSQLVYQVMYSFHRCITGEYQLRDLFPYWRQDTPTYSGRISTRYSSVSTDEVFNGIGSSCQYIVEADLESPLRSCLIFVHAYDSIVIESFA